MNFSIHILVIIFLKYIIERQTYVELRAVNFTSFSLSLEYNSYHSCGNYGCSGYNGVSYKTTATNWLKLTASQFSGHLDDVEISVCRALAYQAATKLQLHLWPGWKLSLRSDVQLPIYRTSLYLRLITLSKRRVLKCLRKNLVAKTYEMSRHAFWNDLC